MKSADTHEQQIERERELVQRYRSHRKISKMHEHEARLERLLEARQDAPKSRAQAQAAGVTGLVGGGPVRSGEIVIRLEDFVVGYLPPSPDLAFEDGRPRAVPCGAAGRARRDRRGRTAPGRRHPADRRGRAAAARRCDRGSGTGSSSATWPSSAAAALPGSTVIDALLEDGPGDARRGARLTWLNSCSAATTS